ncbi:substrate-binding periplasmic protein [Rhizobium sp. LEGMi135b]
MAIRNLIATTLAALSLCAAAAHADDSVLRVGTSLTQMPWGFYDADQKPTGIDVALCGAIATHLGKQPEFIALDFKGLIPALQADRFDMVCAAMYITPEREKAIKMVQYLTASQTVVAKKSANFEGLDGLCGHSVSVLQGSGSLKVLEEASAKCEAGGKSAVAIQSFDAQPVAIRALENDSVEAFIATDSLVSYYMTKNPDLKKIAMEIEPTPLGIGVPLDDEALAQQVKGALVKMKSSGEYDAILKKWGVESATATLGQ